MLQHRIANEKNHKSFVKKPAARTQRIGSRFSSQLAKCDFNRIVIERSYDHIKKFTSRDHSSVIGKNTNIILGIQRLMTKGQRMRRKWMMIREWKK